MRSATAITFLYVSLGVSPMLAQTHPACGGEHHYRWAQKADTSLVAVAVETTTVGTILAHWTPPAISKGNWCTPRTASEGHLYTLVGWVRFVKDEANDNDWHIELTSNRTSPRTSCVIVEIPSDDYGQLFAVVRDSFLAVTGLSDVRQKGDTIRPAVKIRVTGAAFYDGWHRSASGTDGNHGHCNKSQRALWEIHPVYRVEHP